MSDKKNAVEGTGIIEDREFTADESKNQLRMYENDIVAGLLAATNYQDDEESYQPVEIIRNGKLYFTFSIRPLSEEEYDRCKTKHTKYVRNKQLGIKLPETTNTVKYRAALIYQATIEKDRQQLWDNKTIWNSLIESGKQVLSALDVIDFALLSGEKDAVVELIDSVSGYKSNLEDVAKN